MSRLSKDYLWLDRRPRRRKRGLRFILLLLVMVAIPGGLWLYSSTPGAYQTALGLTEVEILPQADSNARTTPADRQPVTTAAKQQPRTENSRGEKDAPVSGPILQLTLSQVSAYDPVAQTAMDVGDEHRDEWIPIRIHDGDTLSTAFARRGLAYTDAVAITRLDEYGKHFTHKLRAGDEFQIKADADGHVVALKYALDATRTLQIRDSSDGYEADITQVELDRRLASVTGTINNSFYSDARRAGLSDRQVMDLADIFKWTINFVYDIRPGDRFTVVYSELYKDGSKVGNGPIMAASVRTGKGLIRALRYTDPNGKTAYYQPDGSSMRRAFIRTPVDYTRISSPFNPGREHPILHTIRAHHGTDYAAPTGTPIHAAGNGTITHRGRKGGYGNLVELDHGRGITTRYGHMSRFASGQSVGTQVEQGDIIGYVGSTGLATGPHLHYEYRVNNKPKDPETVDLPGKPPLPDKYMDEFKTQSKPLIARLETTTEFMLARNKHQGKVTLDD